MALAGFIAYRKAQEAEPDNLLSGYTDVLKSQGFNPGGQSGEVNNPVIPFSFTEEHADVLQNTLSPARYEQARIDAFAKAIEQVQPNQYVSWSADGGYHVVTVGSQEDLEMMSQTVYW